MIKILIDNKLSIFEDIDQFRAHISPKGSLMAIDYGKNRLGIALSDPNRKMGLPLEILILPQKIINQTKNNNSPSTESVNIPNYQIYFIPKIKEIIYIKKVTGIVLGLPLNLNGTLGTIAQEVIVFAKDLAEASSMPLLLYDERFTSRIAESMLRQTLHTSKKNNLNDDNIAANIILNEVLSHLN